MKIGKKELSYLLYLFALLFVVGAIFYGNYLSGKTETLNAENDVLSQEVAYLQDLYDHQAEYQAESDRMNLEMEDIKQQFPAEVRPENQIMYANGLEAKLEVLLDTIEMPGTELVTVQAAVAPVDTTAVTPDATATDADVDAAAGDATQAVDATQAAGATISTAATSISLLRSPTNFEFQSSYKALKDFVRTVNEDPDRKSIEKLSIGYDTETGNLKGVMEVSMYALTGTGKEYEPPVVTGVTDGLPQIFTGATTLNRSGSNKAGDAATADGKAGNAADNSEDDNKEE